MAATVLIRRWTGTIASPVKTDITAGTTRASTSDAPTPGTADPIPIPNVAAPNYSYWVSTRLDATVTPTGTIDNLRWFTDGSNSFGTGVEMDVQEGYQTGYVRATGTQGTSGTLLNSANHTGITDDPSDGFAFTSGSPLSLAGSLDNPNTGDFGQFVVAQLRVVSSAGPGTVTESGISFRYDET